MSRFPGKIVLAGVILSCGLAMHAEPGAKRSTPKPAKEAAARTWLMLRAAEASEHFSRGPKNYAWRDVSASR